VRARLRGSVLSARRRGALVPLLGLVALSALLPLGGLAADNAPEYGIHAGLSGATTLSKNHYAYALPQGGAPVHDSIVVSNFTASPISFDVHGADMLAATGGGLAPAAEGVTPTKVGAWLAVDTATITVPPHSDVSDAFTLSVPATTPPGEYVGAMVVARRPDATSGIRVVTRAALTVDVTVLGNLVLQAGAGPLVGVEQRGDVRFTLTVANHGNVLFTFTGQVTVRDSVDHLVSTIPVAPQGLYVIPGGHADVTAVWHGVPLWGSATATATVEAKTTAGQRSTVTSIAVQLSFVPWAIISGAGAGVAAGLIALVVFSLRRRRSAA